MDGGIYLAQEELPTWKVAKPVSRRMGALPTFLRNAQSSKCIKMKCVFQWVIGDILD